MRIKVHILNQYDTTYVNVMSPAIHAIWAMVPKSILNMVEDSIMADGDNERATRPALMTQLQNAANACLMKWSRGEIHQPYIGK